MWATTAATTATPTATTVTADTVTARYEKTKHGAQLMMWHSTGHKKSFQSVHFLHSNNYISFPSTL